MTPHEILESLLYLDRGYIADLYEVVTGDSPSTTVTKNQGKKAGASLQIFSAEVSAQETRSYPISTLAMLSAAMIVLRKEKDLVAGDLFSGMASKYGWIDAELTVFSIRSTVLRHRTSTQEILAEDEYFQLRQKPDLDIALITTPEYFSSGIDAFLKMQRTLLKELSLPVRAFVRIFAAQSHTAQWVGVPLVILERRSGA